MCRCVPEPSSGLRGWKRGSLWGSCSRYRGHSPVCSVTPQHTLKAPNSCHLTKATPGNREDSLQTLKLHGEKKVDPIKHFPARRPQAKSGEANRMEPLKSFFIRKKVTGTADMYTLGSMSVKCTTYGDLLTLSWDSVAHPPHQISICPIIQIRKATPRGSLNEPTLKSSPTLYFE